MARGMLAALALAAAAPNPAPPPVDVGGRVVRAQDGSMRFGWPGVYFEGRFRGTGVTVAAEPGNDQLRLLVDGQSRGLLTGNGPGRVTIGGLAPGAHVVRLEKLTESQSGSARFLGFWPAAGGTALPARPRARRIEFIGDSHSVGYGDTSAVRTCSRDAVHDTTDTQQAFGPLLAKRLDADYRIVAYSGFGIVRNYAGAAPGDSLPSRYARAIPGEASPWRDDGWRPDWIVIDLGSNDFSTPLHDGEAWAGPAALHADYRATYAAFVRMLLARDPRARLLLVAYPLFDADVTAVAASVADRRVTIARIGPLALTACDWHPSLKDHRDLADALQREMARVRAR